MSGVRASPTPSCDPKPAPAPGKPSLLNQSWLGMLQAVGWERAWPLAVFPCGMLTSRGCLGWVWCLLTPVCASLWVLPAHPRTSLSPPLTGAALWHLLHFSPYSVCFPCLEFPGSEQELCLPPAQIGFKPWNLCDCTSPSCSQAVALSLVINQRLFPSSPCLPSKVAIAQLWPDFNYKLRAAEWALGAVNWLSRKGFTGKAEGTRD